MTYFQAICANACLLDNVKFCTFNCLLWNTTYSSCQNVTYICFRNIANTVRGYKFNNLAINSSSVLAAEPRVDPALPVTAVVEFMAKWSNLCPRTVYASEVCLFVQMLLIEKI